MTVSSSFFRPIIVFLQRLILRFARRWEFAVNTVFGLILFGAMLAPGLMALGLDTPAQTIYRWYQPHNHQLPHRSFFVFSNEGGVKSLGVEALVAAGAAPYALESFLGNADIGYKMALNQRMVAIFLGLFLGGLLWSSTYFQPRINRWGLAVLSFPMFFDALSHLVAERTGFFLRELNSAATLAAGQIYPDTFFMGTGPWTYNWLMRLLTGVLFGLATVWYLYPYFEDRFGEIKHILELRFRRMEKFSANNGAVTRKDAG